MGGDESDDAGVFDNVYERAKQTDKKVVFRINEAHYLMNDVVPGGAIRNTWTPGGRKVYYERQVVYDIQMALFQHITRTKGVLGGKAHLRGCRISVADVVEHLKAGEDVAEIAETLQVAPVQVTAAQEYWEAYPEEIEAQLQSRDELYDELLDSSRAPPT